MMKLPYNENQFYWLRYTNLIQLPN